MFDIESIVKDSTLWAFYKPAGNSCFGKFVLNGDTNRYYMVYYMGQYTTIVEDPNHGQQNLGGSARPFNGVTSNLQDSMISISLEQVEGVINGYNCNYFSVLTFQKIKTF